MSSTDTEQDVDQGYVDNGTQAAEDYANRESRRKMSSNLKRPSQGSSKPQAKTPGAPVNPNIQRGGFGVPNAVKGSRNIQRGGLGQTGANVRKQLANKAIDTGLRAGATAAGVEPLGEAAIWARKHKRETLELIVISIIVALFPLLLVFWLIFGPGSASQPCSGGTVGNQKATGEKSTAEYMAIYGHNPAEVEANLVSINFQGKSVKVHKKVQAVFEKVNNEITQANTGYAFRRVGTYAWRQKNGSGTNELSTHSFGITIDINDDTNPYTTADTHDIPPQVAQIFKDNGFAWGGDWQPKHDWMHFQYEGSPDIAATAGDIASNAATTVSSATASQVGNGSTTAGGGASTGCPPAGNGGASGGYLPPVDDNCGGKYKLTSSLARNFGDPQCNFDKNQLYLELKTADPANADTWFNKIIPCESGFNPNAYAGPSTGTPDAAGAWGLTQMGSANPPGSPPPAPGKNGPNDRGDVNWQLQATNATTYGLKIGDLKKYWACAR